MARYEAVADAARIAEGRMTLFREALREKAEHRVAEERRSAEEEAERSDAPTEIYDPAKTRD